MTRKTLTLSAIFLLVLGLHAIRAPWQLFEPVFYGEEGRIFFLENHTLGWSALWKTYAGYLHLYPRIIAGLFGYVEIIKTPFWYHLSALLAHAILLYSVLRFSFDLTSPQRLLLMLATILIPHGGEVFLNLPNTINILGPVPILLFLAPRTSFQYRIFDFVLAVLAGLSGPYILIFCPFMIGHILVTRKGSKTIAVAAIIAALTQFFFMNLGDRAPMTEAISFASSMRMLTSFAYPLFFSWLPAKMSVDQMLGLLIIVFGALFWFARKSIPKAKATALLLLSLGLIVWLAGLFRGLGDASWMHPFGGAQRYFWVPYTLFTMGLICQFSERRRFQLFFVFCIFASALANWRLHIPSYQVKPSFEKKEASGTVRVSVYPSPEWDFEYKP